jgi:RNA polymerase sigma-70 factor, ECF subfamily
MREGCADAKDQSNRGRGKNLATGAEGVYERFDGDLRRFVRRRVGDPDAAEDVLQDVYLKIHSRIGTLEDEEKVAAWVYAIARNAVRDFYRARRPAAELGEIPEEPPDPEAEELGADLARSVGTFLDGLAPEHRQALRLTEYEGLTQRELADRLGISVSGAKSRVQRARTRLKAMLLDCCHFELDRRGRVLNYYDHAFAPEHDHREGEPQE